MSSQQLMPQGAGILNPPLTRKEIEKWSFQGCQVNLLLSERFVKIAAQKQNYWDIEMASNVIYGATPKSTYSEMTFNQMSFERQYILIKFKSFV